MYGNETFTVTKIICQLTVLGTGSRGSLLLILLLLTGWAGSFAFLHCSCSCVFNGVLSYLSSKPLGATKCHCCSFCCTVYILVPQCLRCFYKFWVFCEFYVLFHVFFSSIWAPFPHVAFSNFLDDSLRTLLYCCLTPHLS